jgi:hypothetical protein
MSDEYVDRRGLTFAQAEGVEPLPAQLALRELSQALRVRLSKVLLESLGQCSAGGGAYGMEPWVKDPWEKILYDKHVFHDNQYADDYNNNFKFQYNNLSRLIRSGSYIEVLGVIQFILTHSKCPYRLDQQIEWALRSAKAAYRVVEGGLIVPAASEAEGAVLEKTFADLEAREFGGARQHMREAGRLLTAGAWADSVRQSIQAVESVARTLEPSAQTLGPALDKLARNQHLHPAFRAGVTKLYGYTSDEEGIRHSLLEDGDAKVDEADALYMFGACASFVSYLIGKGRAAKLID